MSNDKFINPNELNPSTLENARISLENIKRIADIQVANDLSFKLTNFVAAEKTNEANSWIAIAMLAVSAIKMYSKHTNRPESFPLLVFEMLLNDCLSCAKEVGTTTVN